MDSMIDTDIKALIGQLSRAQEEMLLENAAVALMNRAAAALKATISSPTTGNARAVPFEDLCFGAKFRYRDDLGQVWVKVYVDRVAQWDASLVTAKWIGQKICSFDEDDDFSRKVFPLSDQ